MRPINQYEKCIYFIELQNGDIGCYENYYLQLMIEWFSWTHLMANCSNFQAGGLNRVMCENYCIYWTRLIL